MVVAGGFDSLRSREIRLLEEASRLGDVTVLLWSDETLRQATEAPPAFPEAERLYLLRAIRYVTEVRLVSGALAKDTLPEVPGIQPAVWIVDESQDNETKRAFCAAHGLSYRVILPERLRGFPDVPLVRADIPARHKKVLVTGCYDWFHSGHVRFFEEASAYADLYVVVGHDANIRLLKGEGHPMFPQEERRYMVQSVRFVKQALISTGDGWLDAEPEIQRLKPDIYAVNEDGDKGGKRDYCEKHGIQYLVLKRTPAPGLPRRTSTNLRGF